MAQLQGPLVQQQSAHELISAALAKIRKNAVARKHGVLLTQAKELEDKLSEVLAPGYALKAPEPRQQAPSPAPQQPQAADASAAGALSPEPSAPGTPTGEMASAAAEAAATAGPADGAGAAGDAADVSDAAAGAAEAGQAQRADAADDGSAAAAAAEATAAAAAAEAAVAARAQAAKREADAARLTAAAAPVAVPRDLVPRTETAISDAAAVTVLKVMRTAIDTAKPNVVEVALDLIHKLIALRYLQGAAYAVSSMERGQGAGDAEEGAGSEKAGVGAAAADPAAQTPQAVAVELICRCDDITDESVEVLVLRGLLTATTSATFTLHAQALLLAVRTCYNIFLMSRSEVNQTTAKATLTQMLNVVFQRMEAGSVLVQVKPIAVSDVLGLPRGSAGPELAVSNAVQNFLNSVISAAGYGNTQQSAEELKSSVAGAFERHDSHPIGGAGATGAAVGGGVQVTSDSEEDDDREQFRLGSSVSIGGEAAAAAAAAVAAAGAAGGAAQAQAASNGSVGPSGVQRAAAASSVFGATPAAAVGGAVGGEGGSGAPLAKDAFLVFRALCKLSIRTSDSATMLDPTAVRGKVLALELLKVLLENSGPAFRTSERFIAAIRQYLCLSLLKNAASSIPAALQLSCSIFLSLLQRFRSALKPEVGVFFPMILLKSLEPPAGGGAGGAAGGQSSIAVNAYSYKVVVLRCLREACADGQLLVDLFVNFDCDLDSSNLFERLINGLVKIAQQPLPPPGDYTATQQEQWLRQEALQCLVAASQSLLGWYRAASGQGAGDEGSDDGRDEDGAAGVSSSSGVAQNGSGNLAAAISAASPLPPGSAADTDGDTSASGSHAAAAAAGSAAAGAAGSAGGGGGGDALSRKRAYKEKFQEGVALFNKKPKKGIALLQEGGMLGPEPSDIAAFLAKTEGLDKVTVGDYLGERDDTCLKVMHAYVDAMEFAGMEFDTAIRAFLQGFRLPGEAQKIDRLMEKFAERFCKCNPGSFKSADVAYVLAYSVIMLNTDAHNPQVKNKMSCEGFLKNNRGINDGADLPPDFMRALYDRIVNNEIKIKDAVLPTAGSAAKEANAAERVNQLLMNALWSIVGGHKAAVSAEPSDDAIKRTLDSLHARAKGATFFTAREADTVRPMLELIWAPLLGALSVLFDEYQDARLVTICLDGFTAVCCLVALLGVSNLRDIWVNSLCNFTHLHSPATMKVKNALAFKALLKVAAQVGGCLDERWVEVLRCISRWELLQQIASGMPTDAALFSLVAPGSSGVPAHEKNQLGKAAAALREQLRKLTPHSGSGTQVGVGAGGVGSSGDAASAGSVKSMDSLAMSEVSIKRTHIGSSGRADDEALVVPSDIINAVDSSDLSKVYTSSAGLDSDAIVHFVRALAAISLDELRDASAPRVFSLTKIVEIAHYNMTRIRLVWSRIWAVLSEYFIAVGCHANLAVAMYAVDSLRQLAMKFLERDELANYTFQNDFLRPFVVVMRQSQAIEIRELIIRCLSQMVLARVNNVKSGWKSMFMVFTTAAGDRDPTIVRLAFDTIEKIVREHFGHITETETTTFTDCVNCLIAFTNNPHSLEVALNAIAFLRFCASRLAEGAIGDIGELPEGSFSAENLGRGSMRMVALDGTPGSSNGGSSSGGGGAVAVAAARSAAAGVEGSAEGGGGAGGKLRFVDKDEHVYFWFPLLAGLSELTFDPRQEIRHSALEVLFDVLKVHGGAFAGSFWARIYDSVLLPIFDHVRAEVTDTTTFTSERRRQQEDAWLFETCTRCLQHLVDLFVQFYATMRPQLPRLLELLGSFMVRPHQSLASVGVAAFTRLLNSCGPLMDGDTWLEVVNTLQFVARDTLPDAAELVTPPSRSTGPGDSSSSGVGDRSGSPLPPPSPSGNTSASPGSSGGARPPYSLREGVGARRVAKFRCKGAVQLLLVQACSEVYARQHAHMGPRAVVGLLDALALMGDNARGTNTDGQLRRRLVTQQAEDRVPEERTVPDPPLLRLETEAAHAYLSVLLHISSMAAAAAAASGGSSSNGLRRASSSGNGNGAESLRELCGAQERMVALTYGILERFGLGVGDDEAVAGGSGGSSKGEVAGGGRGGAGGASHATSTECTSLAPLVVSTLKALSAFDEPTFRHHLPRFFPALARLVKCGYAPADVQRALSDLLLHRVYPMVQAAQH